MAVGDTKWKAPTNLSAASLSLNGVTINDGAGDLSAEYDNESNLYQFGIIKFSTQHGSDPSAGVWRFYLVLASDGTNYEDGGDAVQPAKSEVAILGLRAVTTAQVLNTKPILLPPTKFKILPWNDTGVNSSASAVSVEMELYGHNTQLS